MRHRRRTAVDAREKGKERGKQDKNPRQKGPGNPALDSESQTGWDLDLNRRIVGAPSLSDLLDTLDEVLPGEAVSELSSAPESKRAQRKARLSAVNAVTFLHRVARHVAECRMGGAEKEGVLQEVTVRRALEAARGLLQGIVGEKERKDPGRISTYFPPSKQLPRLLANLAWALAKLTPPPPSHPLASDFDLLRRALLFSENGGSPLAESLSAQHVANVGAAYALSRHWAPDLLHALGSRGATLVHHQQVSPQEVSQLLWAHAVLHTQPPHALWDALDQLAQGGDELDTEWGTSTLRTTPLSKWSEQQLSTCAWACAVVDGVRSPFFWGVWREIQSRQDAFCLGPEEGWGTQSLSAGVRSKHRHLSQLHQAAISLLLLQRTHRGTPRDGTPQATLHSLTSTDEGDVRDTWVWRESEKAWRAESEAGQHSRLGSMSVCHRDVCQILSTSSFTLPHSLSPTTLSSEDSANSEREGEEGQEWEVEYSGDDTWHYSLDLAVPALRVGLEIDGPSHFCSNCRLPLGPTVLKRRHLEALGWRMISVPYQEWEELQSLRERQVYLQRALMGEGVQWI